MIRPPRLSVALSFAGVMILGTAGAAVFRPRPHAAGFPLPRMAHTLRTAPACPLTRAEEQDAIKKFEKLLPVVLHPRCANCHGGVDPYVDRRVGKHGGGKIRRAFDRSGKPVACPECHELVGWDIPIEPFFFVGKDARELCMQFKRFEPSPDIFVGHVTNENGRGAQFTASAFVGDRSLLPSEQDEVAEETGRPFSKQPPPGTHAQFIAHAREWVDALGDGYKVLPDCGCVPTGSAWVGTVKTFWERKTVQLGNQTATALANVRFVIDSSFDVTDDVAEYWKSVSGTIVWETSNSGGECKISGAGTTPIGLGADLNPMATLRGEHDDKGGITYGVSLGPWPDKYDPLIKWDCPEHDLQSNDLGSYIWWGHELTGMNSPDGKTLKGSYHTAAAGATMSWEWDLHLEP